MDRQAGSGLGKTKEEITTMKKWSLLTGLAATAALLMPGAAVLALLIAIAATARRCS